MKILSIVTIIIIMIFIITALFILQNEGEDMEVDWREIELKDIRTGDTFKIADLKKPVLLESFAVWCPTCKEQQDKIRELHEEFDNFISVSLDTDPNEAEDQIRNHFESNGYNWIFAISPIELTKGLINDFTVSVINAPTSPVVLLCDGEERLLKRGVKSKEELKKELDSCL